MPLVRAERPSLASGEPEGAALGVPADRPPLAGAPDGSVIAFVSTTDGAIHTVTPSGADDISIGTPVDHGSIYQLDWQPR
jgi:hypothetical protein